MDTDWEKREVVKRHTRYDCLWGTVPLKQCDGGVGEEVDGRNLYTINNKKMFKNKNKAE